jgi:endonuclease/exonuclease/phosphatase family metal-dependent hydrolase
MRLPKPRTFENWALLLLVVVTVLLGAQLLRANLAYFRWLFGERLGWSSLQLGGLGLGLYSLTILVGPFLRRMGTRPLLVRTAFVVGATRLLAQIWWGDPLLDALFVFVGVLAFLIFLPVALGWMVGDRIHKPEAGWHFALLLLSGLALDSAIHSLFLTYDPIWQNNWYAFGTVLLLVGGQWWLLRVILRRVAVPLPFREASLRNSLPLLLFGPFFVYYLIVGGNLARLNALTGWPLPLSVFWLLAGLFAAVLLGWLLPPGRAVALVAFVLLMTTINPPAFSPIVSALSLLVSQISAGLLLTTACTHLARYRSQTGVGNTAWVWWGSQMLSVLLIFLYYVTYDIRLPISREFILYLTVVCMGAGALFAVDRWAASTHIRPALDYLGLPSLHSLALTLALVLALTTVIWQKPAVASAQSDTLRLFDYNMHNGFSMRGTLDLEAMAQLIESQGADILALQEVGRGWVVNGSVDMVVWLSWRLGMPATFTPTSGLGWGHGIFSRYPVIRHDKFALPTPGLPLGRGFAYHEIDVGNEQSLLLINTHLDYSPTDASIREMQTASILHFLEGNPMRRLILTGDLNSQQMEPVLLSLQAVGLRDLIGEAGLSPGFTFPADQPSRRIDYILASPDIGLRELTIPPDVISDHLGISATIVLR